MNDQRPLRLGLVHTVPALGAVFEDLLVQASGNRPAGVEVVHVTDPWLLATAVADGVTPGVNTRLAAHVDHLIRLDVDGVLVTCSSLGEATEEVAARAAGDVPIVRVDQGLADRAVELTGAAGRIAVLATLASTVGPTVRLLERSAAAAGGGVTVDVEVLGDARQVPAAVERAAEEADVVVLAQASMARAVDLDADRDVAVLASPALAAHRLIDVTRSRT